MNDTISIITAVFNGQALLPRLLESIVNQDYENFELIIIDGNSTDETVQVIKEYEANISYWISEPDSGIYDAWNKGLKEANGKWIMFLGSDDILLPQALSSYMEFITNLRDKDTVELISSKVRMIDKRGRFIRSKGSPFHWPLFLKEMTIAHPGALHSKQLFEVYGDFNTDYKIVGDYEFLLRPGKDLKALFMDEVTVLMSEGGASDSIKAILEHCNAVISTGQHPSYKAYMNAMAVIVKFNFKILFRAVGVTYSLNALKTSLQSNTLNER